MTDLRVEQDIFKAGHVLFEGGEAEVYIYLKKWNFPEASMVWVVDEATGDKTGSTQWFNATRRRLVGVLVVEAAASVYGADNEAFNNGIVDRIMQVI